ncbi:MAG: hypothetical protein PHH82_04810 [Candidatus ainarchaeum sp.]|jgi:hypothetical protein|nr:hypothetical protein [Candidatus ainarchaeum sp.]
MGVYNWNDWITVKCRKKDKKKLKKIYEEWLKTSGIKISFHAYINCVLFEDFFKLIQKRQDDKKRQQEKRINEKYKQLLQLRKERNLKYGKRRSDNQ